MRLALSINQRYCATAKLPEKGFLGAHINLRTSNGIDGQPAEVWMGAIDTSGELSSTHLRWPATPLREGDMVEIRVLPDGPSDAPSQSSVTSDRAENLFTEMGLAKRLIELVEPFMADLWTFVDQVKKVESPEEFKKVALAIGSVFVEIDRCLLFPTYRRHTSLIPEGRKDELV